MDIKSAYLKKIGDRGDFKIWLVDGAKIRKDIDTEFNNFGHHFEFDFIPRMELWLDAEAAGNERGYFIDHMITEWRLMEKGADYKTATNVADMKESSERKKSKAIRRIINKEKPEVIGLVHKEFLGKTEDGVLSVWLVDGGIVRSVYDVDFTEGGHDLVYDYVPKNEVWIDDDITHFERPYVILHELYERDMMSRGIDYDSAHDGTSLIEGASSVEWRARHDLKKLKNNFDLLGWSY